nr:hypothetical protein [Tanacetum cinerariifolium]
GYGAGLFWGRWGIMGRSGVRVVEEWQEWWGSEIIGWREIWLQGEQ